MILKSIKISFADRNYLVYNDGTIWSEWSNRYIKGKCISGDNKRLVIDVRVNGKTESLLIHRLVFFFHYYNKKIIKKENPTMNHFKKMPLIYHISGDILNNALSNLKSVLNRKTLSQLIYKEFPEKFVGRPGTSKIKGADAIFCKKALLKGESYASIAKIVNTSDMAVFRFAKFNNLIGNRQNGTPKLTAAQVLKIRKSNLPGVSLAKMYNVTETCISRVRNNKTYTSGQNFMMKKMCPLILTGQNLSKQVKEAKK